MRILLDGEFQNEKTKNWLCTRFGIKSFLLQNAGFGMDSVFEQGSDYRSIMPQYTTEGFEKGQELLALQR